ncbi:glutamyl-tRNA reductase [bacterium B17]|nr:glutamyl-tRNA reductase [bacterium B17]
MNFSICGINFKTSQLPLREKVSFSPGQLATALKIINHEVPNAEAMLLSTCNRTELYLATENIVENHDQMVELLGKTAGVPLNKDDSEHFYFKTGIKAAKHLISVAASLDSMVVGETEILGQVKQAYAAASKAQPGCKFIHRLMNQINRTAKRIHTETDISRGRVSVSSIAVEFARKIFDHLENKTAMIVGAGETSELTMKSLVSKGIKNVIVCNRSPEKGKTLAEHYGGEAIDYDQLDEHLPIVDIVVSSTSAPHCVIKAESIRRAITLRHERPMLLIDIAVPRDIEEEADSLEDVYLYDIDDLQKVATENLKRRKKSVDDAWGIIEEELPAIADAMNS